LKQEIESPAYSGAVWQLRNALTKFQAGPAPAAHDKYANAARRGRRCTIEGAF